MPSPCVGIRTQARRSGVTVRLLRMCVLARPTMSAHRPTSAAHTPAAAHTPSSAHMPLAAATAARPPLQHQASSGSAASTTAQPPSRTPSRSSSRSGAGAGVGGPSRTPSRTGSITRQSASSGHLTSGITGGIHPHPYPVWRDKDQTKQCCNLSCSKPFGLLRTKNHCRYCGDIFCQDCLGFAMVLQQPRVFVDGSTIPAGAAAAAAAGSTAGAGAGASSRYPKGKLMPPVQGKVKLCKRCCSELHQMEMQTSKLARTQGSQHLPQHTASNGSVSSAAPTSAASAAGVPPPLTSAGSAHNVLQRVTRSSSTLRTAASSPTGEQSSGVEGQLRATSTTSAPAATSASSAAGALVRSGSRSSARTNTAGATNHAMVLQPSTDQQTSEDRAALTALAAEFSSHLEQLEQCRLDEGGQMQSLKAMLELLHTGALLRLPNPYAAFVALLDFASGPTFAGAQAAVHVQTIELLQLLSLALLNAPGEMVTLYQSAHVSHENALESLTHLIESQGQRLAGVRQHCLYLLSATTCVLHLLSHTDTHRTHYARHGRNLILTGLAFFGLGDVPLSHMLDELGHAFSSMVGARKAKALYPKMMRMWLAMPRRDATPSLDSIRELQATFGVYLGSEGAQHWELPITYLALLHRWVQFLSRTDTCESLSIHQRQSLSLSLLFGAVDPVSGESLPGLLSGKKFSTLCSRSDWKVREKVVSVAMDILADAGRSMPIAPPQRAGSRAQKKKAAAAELQVAAAAAACGSTSGASSSAAASGLVLVPSTHYSYPPMILELLSSLLLERQILERHSGVLETLHSGPRMHELKQALAMGWSRRKGEVESMLEAQGQAVAALQSSLERALSASAGSNPAEIAALKNQLAQAQSEFTQSRAQISEMASAVAGVASSVQEVLARSTAIQASLDAQSALLSQIAAGTSRVEHEVKLMAAQLEAVSHEVRRSRDFTESIVTFQSMRAVASATPPVESPNSAAASAVASPWAAASPSPTAAAPTAPRRVSGGAAAAAASACPSPRHSSAGASSPTTPLAAAAVGSRIPLFAASAATTPGLRMALPSGAASPRLVSPRPAAPVRSAPVAAAGSGAAAAPVRSVSHKRRNHEIDADIVPPPSTALLTAATAAAASPVSQQPIKRARAQLTQAVAPAAAARATPASAAAPSPRASAKPAAVGGLSRSSAVAGARPVRS